MFFFEIVKAKAVITQRTSRPPVVLPYIDSMIQSSEKMISSINIDCNRYILIRFPWSAMTTPVNFRKFRQSYLLNPTSQQGGGKSFP